MTVPGQEGRPLVTPEIAAEAAVWVARLHGPDRSSHMERECRAWQARSAAHRLAFECCTDTWQDVAGVTLSTYALSASIDRVSGAGQKTRLFQRRRWAASLTALTALTALTLVGVLVLQPWRIAQTYSTGVGEQRVVMLQDGTRMSLNTATRVRVELGPAQRTVRVEGGEALFEVAKDVHRPFVVRVAVEEVVATGTAFVVRFTPGSKGVGEALAVTLVEGHVVVRNTASDATGPGLVHPIQMETGERVRLSQLGVAATHSASKAAVQLDRPRMDQVLAWKRGEAIFDDVSLLDAVAEMNRYSQTPIKAMEVDALGGLRVSGVFQTGDNASFARAAAALHGLVVRERADDLELASK